MNTDAMIFLDDSKRTKHPLVTTGELSHLSTIPATSNRFSYSLTLSHKDVATCADEFLATLEADLGIIKLWIEEIKSNNQ